MPSRSSTLRDYLIKSATADKPLDPNTPAFPTGWRTPTTPQRQQELHMWREWKESGESPEKMEPLLNSLQPLINKRVGNFRGAAVKKEVLRSHANQKAIQGLRRFDPTRAQMHTFLTHELKGLQRYAQQRQNLSRIVEERAGMIGDYHRAHATLSDTLNREPTAQEIADYMKVDMKAVTRLSHEYRQDLLASGSLEDPFLHETPRHRQVLQLIHYELTPTEMQVFEYLAGHGGKPKVTSTGDIARRLGWSDSKVSQTKNAIAKKIQQYL